MTTIHLAKPNRYFSGDVEGISYTTVEEISQWLFKQPEIVTYEYSESMIRLANVHAAWADYKGMRENLNFLVDVRIRVAELRGENHLS